MRRTALALAALGALALAPAAARASGCPDEPPSSQVFLNYGDEDFYFLAPGGDFTPGAPAWTPSGGATTDSVLSLAPGASATSPPICVGRGYETARMFGQAVDGPRRDRARVRVDVLNANGNAVAGRNRQVQLDEQWTATRSFALGEKRFVLDPETETTTIQLRFTGLGPATALVDDLYIDPRMRN